MVTDICNDEDDEEDTSMQLTMMFYNQIRDLSNSFSHSLIICCRSSHPDGHFLPFLPSYKMMGLCFLCCSFLLYSIISVKKKKKKSMALYYKFKSARDYHSIQMDGPFISVGTLKENF